MLREVNRQDAATLPKSVPTGFVRGRWATYVMPGGVIDHRHYELCVLSELRDRLRAGEVWVAGSRQYRSVDERLISKKTLRDMLRDGTLPVAVDPDFDKFLEGRQKLLAERLAQV